MLNVIQNELDSQYPLTINQRPRLKPQMETDYFPLPKRDIERSGYQSSTPSSSWSVIFWKYAPFYLHFTLVALVAGACLFFIDGQAFNSNSRRPQYQESNGTFSHVTSYAPLQSDIATAVSLAATATRVAGGWWSGGYLLRCIFIAMEQEGISLEGLSRVVSNIPPAPRHLKRRSNVVIIVITIFFTYAIDYFSAALTGSIVWEAADRLIPGSLPVTGIPRGVNGDSLTNYFTYADNQDIVVEIGTSSANLAWLSIQPNSTNITEPSTTFRRVVNGTQYLSVSSTLNNVTIPYFTVNGFEWIEDPDPVLTAQQIPLELFGDYGQFSPFFSLKGVVGLLPNNHWGPSTSTSTSQPTQTPAIPQPNCESASLFLLPDPLCRRNSGLTARQSAADPQLGNPQIVSETRLLAFRTGRQPWNSGQCPQNYTIDPGLQVNLHEYNNTSGQFFDCFAIANVSYQAGVAVCHNCPLISPTVVEAHAPLTITNDSFTQLALELTPSLSTYLIFSGYAVPQNYGTRKNYAIELTSRAYQSAWEGYSTAIGSELDDTEVQISLPVLRVKVIPWRVYLWAALHLLVLALGLFFIYIQSYCAHPWVKNPSMAIFWLDTTAVSSDSLGSDDRGIYPWRPKTTSGGMLTLEEVFDAKSG